MSGNVFGAAQKSCRDTWMVSWR